VRREAEGLSQAELTARLAYVTNGAWNPAVQEVTHLETGRRTVIDVEILALALALGCSASWLLTGQGEAIGDTSSRAAPAADVPRFLPGISPGDTGPV
jgi:transcriptional regulator with XRE-family HTH domain